MYSYIYVFDAYDLEDPLSGIFTYIVPITTKIKPTPLNIEGFLNKLNESNQLQFRLLHISSIFNKNLYLIYSDGTKCNYIDTVMDVLIDFEGEISE